MQKNLVYFVIQKRQWKQNEYKSLSVETAYTMEYTIKLPTVDVKHHAIYTTKLPMNVENYAMYTTQLPTADMEHYVM
jgi:hypothetical protein